MSKLDYRQLNHSGINYNEWKKDKKDSNGKNKSSDEKVMLAIEEKSGDTTRTKEFGVISSTAYHAISNGLLKHYTPKDEEEKNVIDKYKEYIGYNNANSNVNSDTPDITDEEKRVLDKYGIDDASFTTKDFENWALEHGYEFNDAKNSNADATFVPKYKGFKKVPTKEEQADFEMLSNLAGREYLKESAKNPVKATLLSIGSIAGAVPIQILSGYANVADAVGLTGVDVPHSIAENAVKNKDLLRETVTKEHASKWFGGASGKLGNYGALTYNGLMSIGDTVATSLTMKSIGSSFGLKGDALTKFTSRATSGLLASNSMQSKILEKKKEGLSDGKAVAVGFTTGLAEFITEKYSLDAIFKAPASTIKKGLISFLAEGSEEGFSDILSKTADYLIAGDDSTIRKNITQYMQNGMSKKDATWQATADSLWETASSVLVGGLSGVAMSSAYHGFGRSEIKKTGADMRGVATDVIESGLDSPKNSNAYKYAEKLSKKGAGNITDYELGLQHIYNIEQIEYEQKKEEKVAKKAEKATRKTQNSISETADTAEQAPTNFPYNVYAEPQISIGDKFKDAKTGNTVTVVERDADSTSIEIDTGAKTETRKVSNTLAENLVTIEQFEPIGNAENAETAISTDTVEKIIAGMTAEEKERHIGWIELKLSNGETNIDAEELAVYKALVAERENTPKNITLTRMGDFYEAYGDEAVELANKLNLTLTPKTINGEKVQMVGFPVSSLDKYKNTLGNEYDFSVSDTPSSTENNAVNEDADLPEAFRRDESGKIRFNQIDMNYDNYNYREDNFNILVQGKAEAENLKGGIVGKYGVHKKDNGYFGVTLLSSGMDIAAFSSFDEALSFATHTNKEVTFNDISYVRNAEGVLTIEATPEFMQYGEQIKTIKSEKAYLQTGKDAETSETVTSINSENMPVTDRNIANIDTVTDTNVSKAEGAESVTGLTESVEKSQNAEETAPVSEDNSLKAEVSETSAEVTNSTPDKDTSSETRSESAKSTAKTNKKVADKQVVAKKKKPATKQNKAKITDFSDFPKVEDSLKEGQTLTLKHTKSLHTVFKDATRVVVGKDVITDGYIAIPRSDEAVSKIKKVVDESIIQYGDLAFEKIYKKDNDVVISGIPKITDKIISGKKEKVYVFKIGNEFYTCQQKHLDALNDGNNTFVANKDTNNIWTVKDENGEVVAAIVPAFKKGSISDEIYDRLDSVADVINAKNLKKAKMAQATLSQEEMNYFGNGNSLITVNVDGLLFLCNSYLLLRTDKYTIDLMTEEYERDITPNDSFAEKAATMFSQDIIGDVTKTANADVYKTDYNGKVAVSEKTGKPIVEKSLTACLAEDTPFCFDTKMFNMLDKASTRLKIIRYTNSFEHSSLIGFDENGNVTGYLCPVRGEANKIIEFDGKQYKYYTKGSLDEKTADTAET